VGARTDWVWDPGAAHRLLAVVSPDGITTGLDWSTHELVVRPGRNVVATAPGAASGAEWRVSLADDRVTETIDPTGGRTGVRYTPGGLLEGIGGVSGASTRVEWRALDDDGVPRVDRMRVVSDVDDAELSMRRWSPGVGGTLASDWPLAADGRAVAGADADAAASSAYETVLSDGATSVMSGYDGRHRLERREVHGRSGAGSMVLQEQTFTYPGGVGGREQGGAPIAWSRPASATVTYTDASGASRSTTASYEYDEQGRTIGETCGDGARIETRYDETVAEGARLPIGLAVSERTIGADGLIAETRHELTGDRAAVAATETRIGHGGELELTGRTAYTVGADGFVTERREVAAGDSTAPPVTTRWSRDVDAAAGTQTVTETVAAGTTAEATSARTASLVHQGVLRETDAVGNVSTAEYDALGRVVEQTDAIGRVTRTAYATAQADGANAVTVTAPDRVAVTEVSDELGRVTELHDNIDAGRPVDGHVRVAETRTYPVPGTVAVTDAWGATTTTTRDAFGRVVATAHPTGLVETVDRDDVAGTATVAVTPTGDPADAELTATQRLDDLGRPVESTGTRADGEAVPTTSERYDGLGRTIASSDGVRETAITYDELGSPATTAIRAAAGDRRTGAEADAAGAAGGETGAVGAETTVMTTQRRFDSFGRSLEKTLQAEEQSRSGGSRELDALGRTVAETDQTGRVSRTEHTADGLVARVVDASGTVEEHTYDPRTRVLLESRVTSPSGAAITTAVEVDARTGEAVAVFDPADRAGTEIVWTTDALGNTTSVRYPDGAEIRHEFDPHGRKLATIDIAGDRTEYAYDVAGRLTGAVQRPGAGTSDGADADADADAGPELSRVGYEYDDLGRMHRLTRGNGVTTEYAFTSAGEFAQETTTRDGAVQSDRRYDYDPSGLLLSRVDRTRDDDDLLHATTTAYTYDPLDRLTRSSVHEGDTTAAPELHRTEYSVTVSGDIAGETVTEHPGMDAQASTTREFEYSPLGELTAITTDGTRREQRFDAAGSLVLAADGTRYDYDAASRLVAATAPDGEVTRTAYWADGSRRSQTSPEGTTGFYWDDGALVNDTHADATGIGSDSGAAGGTGAYLLGAERHARTILDAAGAAVSTAYSTLDRHGNVTALTDASGAVTTEYAYSDYGVTTETRREGATGDADAALGGLHRNPFRYASEYADRDGRQHLQTRVYDAAEMRFAGKDRASLHNLYAYADLNPITKIDPTGRTAWLDWLNVAATGLGSALSVAGGISALSALVTMATGGAALGIFGIAAVGVGLADAAFAGFQVANTLSTTKFMDETATTAASWSILGAGIGIAAAGVIGRKLLMSASKPAGIAGGQPLAHPGQPHIPVPPPPPPQPPLTKWGPIGNVESATQRHIRAHRGALTNVKELKKTMGSFARLKMNAITLKAYVKGTPSVRAAAASDARAVLASVTSAEQHLTSMVRTNAKMSALPPDSRPDGTFITRLQMASSNADLGSAINHLTVAQKRLRKLVKHLGAHTGIAREQAALVADDINDAMFGTNDYLLMF
jgi:RHS repeat-associated protein